MEGHTVSFMIAWIFQSLRLKIPRDHEDGVTCWPWASRTCHGHRWSCRNDADPVKELALRRLPVWGLPVRGLGLRRLPVRGLAVRRLGLRRLPVRGLAVRRLGLRRLGLRRLPVGGLAVRGLAAVFLPCPGLRRSRAVTQCPEEPDYQQDRQDERIEEQEVMATTEDQSQVEGITEECDAQQAVESSCRITLAAPDDRYGDHGDAADRQKHNVREEQNYSR